MTKYRITALYEAISIEVEAENKTEALNIAASKKEGWSRETPIDILDPRTYEIEEII